MSPRLQAALPYPQTGGAAGTLGVSYSDPARRAGNRPPVILVHTAGADMRTWQSRPPAALPPPDNSMHAAPPLQVLPRVTDVAAPWDDPRGLWEALEGAGFPGLSWKQQDSNGALPGGTDQELAAVVDFALQTYGARQVFLVGHGRGGVVCRAYLMDPAGAAKVGMLITLGTPHWGTHIAALPAQVEQEIAKAILGSFGLPGKIAGLVAVPLAARIYNDLTAGVVGDIDMLAAKVPVNSRLGRIMAASRHAHIRYVAVAGVTPHTTDTRIYQYGAGSFVPTGFPPRFHWQEATYPPADQPAARLPLLVGEIAEKLHIEPIAALPELYPEDPGRPDAGDGAVAKHSAWFGDPQPDASLGYVKNLKFPYGHSLLPRRPEVQQAILAELAAAAPL